MTHNLPAAPYAKGQPKDGGHTGVPPPLLL